jgi:hypothetical protein
MKPVKNKIIHKVLDEVSNHVWNMLSYEIRILILDVLLVEGTLQTEQQIRGQILNKIWNR